MAVNPVNGTLAAEALNGTGGADLIHGANPTLVASAAPGFAPVASGLGTAVLVTAAPGETGRLFVLDKTGVVRTLDPATGASGVFLDITAQVSPAGEQGLLGLAFHPDFATNGRFYVFFSNTAGDTVLREYSLDPADRGAVLAGSGRDILTVPQPGGDTNHKAGWIGFGPDGMLHVATGDGGSSLASTGQTTNDLLGAILRIDVNGDAFPADPARNYAIPAGNPFAAGGGAPEIWAWGLRNPYRDGFDRGTGILWIGDVGQGRREEVNLGQAGANYGWALYEGDLTYPGGAPAGTLPPGFVGPYFAYGRDDGDRTVIGGYVHRGAESGLQGQYVFGDFVSGRIWTLADPDGDGVPTRTQRDDGSLFGGFRLTAFGEDGEGTLYALGIDGRLFRLSAGAPTGTLDGADTIGAGAGDDRVFAGAGADRVNAGVGADLVSGMEGDDALLGGLGADTLLGGAGNDAMRGGEGNDILNGGAGRDVLRAEAGADLLIGAAGGDYLEGGAGPDRFLWLTPGDSPGGPNTDRVADFNRAEGDVLDLSALAPGTLAFIGAAPFAASGAQLRAVTIASGTAVQVSLDGGPADLVFVVLGVTGLVASDFAL